MISGSCLCGIRDEISEPIGEALYCEGSLCRNWHGTAFRARLAVPKKSFRFLQGEYLLQSFRSSPDTIKTFCRIFGSPMVNSWDPNSDNYDLAMGSLDDDPGVRPARRIFWDQRHPGMK
jgi:hypothetical protein